jgi:hypothetical protein
MLKNGFGITTILSYSTTRLVLLALLASIIFSSLNNERALAHVFVPDENASLLALINQLKTELELIRYNLKDFNNKNLALEHLADTIKIQNENNISPFVIPELSELDQLIKINFNLQQPASMSYIDEKINNASKFLDERIEFEIDSRDLKNATVQALNIANITDEILREYAMAYDIEPIIAGNTGSMLNMNMSNMPNIGSSVTPDSSFPLSSSTEENNVQNSFTTNKSSTLNATKIVNISNYQSAQALANKALEIFREDLKPLELPSATQAFSSAAIRTSSVSGLEDAISLLINSINEKKPYSDIMQIVHGPVHTDLFLAYNLKMIAD